MASHRFTAATSKEALVEAKKRLGADARLIERRVILSPSGQKLIEIVVADAQEKLAERSTKRVLISVAMAVLVAAVMITILILINPWSQPAPSANTEGPFRIIVLPFENLGSEEQEYFTDGVTDEITTRLTKVPNLEVISFSTAKRYKLEPQPTDVIRAEMGVDLIVSGSVKWDGNNGDVGGARITPRLIRAESDSQIWAKTYNLEQEDIFAVQAEIAERVADVCGIALMDADRASINSIPTDNIEAYREYLSAKFCYENPGYGYQVIAQHADRAVELDPNFAEALAWSSRAHSQIPRFYPGNDEFHKERSLWAAQRAVELAPDLPNAHIALAHYYAFIEREDKKAASILGSAINNGLRTHETLASLAAVYTLSGNYTKALELHLKAGELRLPYKQPEYFAAQYALYLHDYDRAVELAQRSICGSPDDWCAESLLSEISMYTGNLQAARRFNEKILKEASWASTHGHPRYVSLQLDLIEGRFDVAINKLELWPEHYIISGDIHLKQWLLASIYGSKGEHSKRQACLERLINYLENSIKQYPDIARFHSAVGIAYAEDDRYEDAIREGLKGLELAQNEISYMGKTPRLKDMAYIYMLAGDLDLASEYMEKYLTNPCRYAPKMLELDPRWRPLRAHPRFKELASLY